MHRGHGRGSLALSGLRGREECCSRGWGGGGHRGPFPNPPPPWPPCREGGFGGGGGLPAVAGEGGGALPAVAGEGGGGSTPTSTAQNDPHVALIIVSTHLWGGGVGTRPRYHEGEGLWWKKTFSGQKLCSGAFGFQTEGLARNPISPTPPFAGPPGAMCRAPCTIDGAGQEWPGTIGSGPFTEQHAQQSTTLAFPWACAERPQGPAHGPWHSTTRGMTAAHDARDRGLDCTIHWTGVWSNAQPQGCVRREGASEAVGQAVGGGCQSGWGRLLSVTNASEAGTWRQGDSGGVCAGVRERVRGGSAGQWLGRTTPLGN